jgi:hypothetical protein
MPIRAQKLNFFVIHDSFHFGSVSEPIFVLTLELNKTCSIKCIPIDHFNHFGFKIKA